MTTFTRASALVLLASTSLFGCKDKAASAAGASASAAPVAAAGCGAGATKIDPAGYCLTVPAGYKRDDSMYTDEVLNKMGGGKNTWLSADQLTTIVISYKPGDSLDEEVGFMTSALKSTTYKQPVDAPADLPSGKGKFIASSTADGKEQAVDSVTKGAKFTIICKATTKTANADAAALAACKSLSPG